MALPEKSNLKAVTGGAGPQTKKLKKGELLFSEGETLRQCFT